MRIDAVYAAGPRARKGSVNAMRIDAVVYAAGARARKSSVTAAGRSSFRVEGRGLLAHSEAEHEAGARRGTGC